MTPADGTGSAGRARWHRPVVRAHPSARITVCGESPGSARIDILDAPVDRPTVRETTALGAAFLAGWQAGLLDGPEAIAKAWRLDRRFKPAMADGEREAHYRGWRRAVARTLLKPAE